MKTGSVALFLTHRRIRGKQDFGRMEFALSHRKGKDDRNRKPGPPFERKADEPGWAAGLRQLYNSVVDEPLPDSFDDLLKKLDRGSDGRD
jgi:hypothetical protein